MVAQAGNDLSRELYAITKPQFKVIKSFLELGAILPFGDCLLRR